MIKTFESDAPNVLERIGQSIAAADAGEATGLAHSLKGMAANLSADKLREVAAQLEEMGRAGDLGNASACLEHLRSELGRCLGYVPELLELALDSQHRENSHASARCRRR